MSKPDVIFVHGVWMVGSEMMFVRRHLREEYGITGHLFSYPSVRGMLDENAQLLADFVEQQEQPVDIVAHSLGGVVTLRMLATGSRDDVRRVVCMGSPLSGSRAARHLTQHNWGQSILGETIAEGVVGDPADRWAAGATERHEVGIIAGTHALGLGRLITNFDGASDGTIAVSETRLPGAKDHIEMHVSHSGMVVSRAAADQVAAFLQRGEFLRE
jgi:pimeloyl-ACP methyl ester carboxylesterase